MAECGIPTSAHHHEVATGGQCEIDLVPQSLVDAADHVMMAQLRHPQRRAMRGQDGQLHAEAAVRRQRVRASYVICPLWKDADATALRARATRA